MATANTTEGHTLSATHATFQEWTNGRSTPAWGTNHGTEKLAFQQWRHFKEAFAPELIARAVDESRIPVARCLDPFGGSGTTALACQFLGIRPTTVEINPYLADLIRSKVASYDPSAILDDLARVVVVARRHRSPLLDLPEGAPPTMVEPGKGGRWIFNTDVAHRIAGLLRAIDLLPNASHRRLFRVLLGGILVDISNIVVNGKGRRYRANWRGRSLGSEEVDAHFVDAVTRAINDIETFRERKCMAAEVINGDARDLGLAPGPFELAVYSPPYPNSFDYTDVYNVELWTLGYLHDRVGNRALRQATMCSHVQVRRDYPSAPPSPLLGQALTRLEAVREGLWHPRIPNMIGGYFADSLAVMRALRRVLREGATVWMVVGDSRYADVLIPTAMILKQLAPSAGFSLRSVEPFRSMRSSAQQGGSHDLAESLVIMETA